MYSEYYGEYSDYTRKGGVILLRHSPAIAGAQRIRRPSDPMERHEKAERGKTAQLAYSFDIALQNEFSLEENIALARQILWSSL
ncbi:MobA/MobL family protein [Pilosibacter sp. HC1M1C21]|uniref:MobA/MobL family protein n=1 Tax=Pilosibacter sp. HC1M1C21 TaxID=3378803 RepID=UPI00385DC052